MFEYTLIYSFRGEQQQLEGASPIKLDKVTLLSKALSQNFIYPNDWKKETHPTMEELQEYHGYKALNVIWKN